MSDSVKVFVSSTFKDLEKHRKAIQDGLMSHEFTPLAMELFPSKYTDAFTHIKQEIDRADYYILVLGNRYGSYKPDSVTSYTELEYEYALGKGLKVLPFVCSDVSQLQGAEDEPAKADKFAAFRRKIENTHLPSWWSSIDGLKFDVCRSISLEEKKGGVITLKPHAIVDYDYQRKEYHFSLVLNVHNGSNQTLHDSRIEVWHTLGHMDSQRSVNAFGIFPDDSCTFTSNDHRDLIYTPKTPIHPGTMIRLGNIVQKQMHSQRYYTIAEEGTGTYPRISDSLKLVVKLSARDRRLQEATVTLDKDKTNDRLECCRQRVMELPVEVEQFTTV